MITTLVVCKLAYYLLVLGVPSFVIALCIWVAQGGLDRVSAERRRCADILTKYRGEASELPDPDERARLMLVLGLIRSEIQHG